MKELDKQMLQHAITNFHGYSVPIQGPFGEFADHTFVYGLTAIPSEFTCHGVHRAMPVAPPATIAQGELYEVLAMVNGMAIQRNPPVYDNPNLDVCGITYAIDGVCHQIANRILFTGGTIAYNPLTSNNVRGLTLSTMIYGVFGRTNIPMMNRMVAAIMTAAAAGLGSELRTNVEPKIEEIIINRVVESKTLSPFFRRMILDELYEQSSMLKRVETILSERLGNTFSAESRLVVESAVKELDMFMESSEIRQYASKCMYDDALVEKINQKIHEFDKSLFEELGKFNYEKIFKYQYDESFCLCERIV